MNNLGNNLGSMLESAINCQPENGSDSGNGTNDEIETKNLQEGKESLARQIAAVDYRLDVVKMNASQAVNSLEVSPCLNLIDFDTSKDKTNVENTKQEDRTTTLTEQLDDCEEDSSAEMTERLQQNGINSDDDETKVNVVSNGCNSADDDENYKEKEDCDILMRNSETKTKNTEDCNLLDATVGEDEDTELDNRLNGDASVETSVETVVDSRYAAVNSSLNDLLEYKYV